MSFRDAFTLIEHDYPTRNERVEALCRLLLNMGVNPEAPVENVGTMLTDVDRLLTIIVGIEEDGWVLDAAEKATVNAITARRLGAP